jgi:hypothetical protein
MKLKLQGPDYKECDPVQALEDFKKRGMYIKYVVLRGELPKGALNEMGVGLTREN